MDRDKFIEDFVKIEWVEKSKCFGLFPFNMYVEFSDSSCEVHSIAIADVYTCYKLFAEKILFINNVSKVFMALDFPARYDIKYDFVVVFTADKSKDTVIDLMAIPYTAEGNKMSPIMLGESEILCVIYNQVYKVFNKFVKG